MKFWIFGLFGLFSIVFGSQSCYDCFPTDENSCLSPHEHNIKRTNCQEEYEQKNTASPSNPTNTALEFVCFTMQVTNADSRKNGIYRGCTEEGTDPCEFLKYKHEEYNITKCDHCAADNCNTENLEVDIKNADNGDKNGGETKISIPLSVLFLNFFILLKLY